MKHVFTLISGLALVCLLPAYAQTPVPCFSTTNYSSGKSVYQATVADVNVDGRPDIITADEQDKTVSVLPGLSNGRFAARTSYAVDSNPLAVTTGDVNGDGRVDIVSANVGGTFGPFTSSVSILLGQAGGGFAPKTDYQVGYGAYSIVVKDVNGDGRGDIFTANFSDDNISVLLSKADGTFARTNYPAGDGARSIALDDINADGIVDIIVANSNANTVSLFLGQAGGVFAPKIDYPAVGNPQSVAVKDLNADNRLDIVTANPWGKSLSVLLQQPDRSFNRTDYEILGGPASVALADINADGKVDIITANFLYTLDKDEALVILLGQGDGRFGPATNYPLKITNGGPFSVWAGDLDGNGRIDVVTGNYTASTVSVLLNPTSPTLTANGQLSCSTTSVGLSASGGLAGATYSFGGPAVGGVSGSSATVTQPGQYTVTATLDGCGTTAVADVKQNIDPPTGVALTNNGTLSINTPTVTLTAGSATPGVRYTFSAGATPQAGGNTATVTTSGSYSVTATRIDNGCQAQATTTVLGASSSTSCRGGNATVNLTAAGSPTRYEWYLNAPLGSPLRDGAFYSGATTSSLSVLNAQQNSIYYAKVYYADGSSAAYGPYRITINYNCGGRLAAGLEAGTELRITLLGNPLTGEALRALVEGAADQRLQVDLLDMSGRPLRSQVFEAAGSAQALEWSLNNWASGVYLLQARSGNQQQHVKVIKP